MKKAILLSALLLAGCGMVTTGDQKAKAEKEELFTYRDEYLSITTDKETGCQYIILRSPSSYGDGVSITPRLKPDGTPYCK